MYGRISSDRGCFLAWSSLDQLSQTHDIQINWRSFELRPADAPPISEEYRAAILAKRPQTEQMAERYYGVTINSGPFGINSRPALVGAKYAEAMGNGPAYHETVLKAYWQEAKDISDLNVLRELAESAGLDGEAFLVALDEPEYQEAVHKDVVMAYQMGITGVPAMVFNNKYLVSGAQTTAGLKDIMRQNPGS